MRKGFTLVEIMVAIALVGAMFAVFGTALTASAIRSRARFETQATALAEGALAAALSLPSSALTDRTASPAIGLVEKIGKAEIAATATAPSAPNAFAVMTTSTSVAGVTFSTPLPDGPYDDFTASVSVLAPTDAGADWRSGLVIRARDLEDCYRFTIGTSSLVLEKLTDGTASQLYSAPTGLNSGDWTALSIVASGANLSIYRDGIPLTTVTDQAYGYGDIALISEGGSLGSFDDLSVVGARSASWDFDSEATGSVPSGLRSLGASDLPNGLLGLTVSHPTSEGTLAQVDATVSWQTSRGAKSVTATGYAR